MPDKRSDPRTPAERHAIAEGQRRRWAERRKKVDDLNADVTRLLTAVQEATLLLAETEGKVRGLVAENRRLKAQLGIQTKRDKIRSQLAAVDAQHRAEISGVIRPHSLEKILTKRRVLEAKLSELERKRR